MLNLLYFCFALYCFSFTQAFQPYLCNSTYEEIGKYNLTLLDIHKRRPIGSDAKHPVEFGTYKGCPLVIKCGDIVNEFNLMYRLRSIYIAQVYGIVEGCMLMKLYDWDADKMPNKHQLTVAQKLRYALHIAQAIQYVLMNAVDEFSIKPQNVLFSREDDRFVLTDIEKSLGPPLFRPPFGISPTFAFSSILLSFFGVSVNDIHRMTIKAAPRSSRAKELAKGNFMLGILQGDAEKYCRTYPPRILKLPSAPTQVKYLYSQCRQLVVEARPTIPEVIDSLRKLIANERIAPKRSKRIYCTELAAIVKEHYPDMMYNLPQIEFNDIQMSEFIGVLEEDYASYDPVFRGKLLHHYDVLIYMTNINADKIEHILTQEQNSLISFKGKHTRLKKIGIAFRTIEDRTKAFIVFQEYPDKHFLCG